MIPPAFAPFKSKRDQRYAIDIVKTVAWLAGRTDYFSDQSTSEFFSEHSASTCEAQSADVFRQLATAFNYQGISDAVARSYMQEHGVPVWDDLASDVKAADCPLLHSFWHFHGCGYRKLASSCSQPDRIDRCPLPRHEFRNGNLNQLAYSLYLFIRDVADGDIVGWIDTRLAEANAGLREGRLSRMSHALITPLLGLHGASHKILNMALSDLLLSGRRRNRLWGEVGSALIAIDSLVHNFLSRTGILKRAGSEHPYGPQCYGPKGCAAVLFNLSESIDARQFNGRFPKTFPRYIQHAIWTYCSGEGANMCNGNRINDTVKCQNRDCRLFETCDRKKLGRQPRKAQ
ncbi:MAG TPA: hypothetical protein VH206_01310 [Xanthobacteraceae bacterium]|jgi:hypothetical protein|nr:hypothetical protein [Xanthobacteraceae bacterium]